MKRFTQRAATIGAFVLNIQAIAAEEPKDNPFVALSLEELLSIQVVTAAAGFEQPIEDAPAAVTVIHRDEWRAAGATELNHILHMAPGVHVTKVRTGITSNTPLIRGVAGAQGQQVLILIDGKPFRYLQNSGRFVNQRLPLDSYSRVEIVRGPGSAVYGADAVGGVINLVTEKYARSSLSVSAASFDTYDVAWRQRGRTGEVNWQLAMQYQTTEGDADQVVHRDLQSTFDEVFGTSASNAPGRFNESYEVVDIHVNIDWHALWLSGHYHDMQDIGLGAGVAQALDTEGSGRYQSEHLRAGARLLETDIYNLQFEAGYSYSSSETELQVFPRGAVLPIGEDGNVNFVEPVGLVAFPDGFIGTPSPKMSTTHAALTYLFNAKSHTLRAEVGYEKQRITANERKNFGPSIIDGSESSVDGTLTDVSGTPWVYLPNAQRELTYISVQDQWQIDAKWTAVAGLRFDQYSDFGSTTNPRFSISWQATPKLTLKSFAGTAFRPPAFVELYAQNNPAGLGNLDLRAEKGQTFEFGFSSKLKATKNVIFELNAYQFDIEDIIEYVPDPVTGIQTSTNIGEQSGWGIEFEGRWRANQTLDIKGHVAYQDSEDAQGNDVVGVPDLLGYMQAQWQLADNWSWFSSVRWVGERKRAVTDTRDPLDGYTWFSSRVAYTFNNYELSLFADNLLDEDAREPSNGSIPDDFPLHGRSLAFQIYLRY